MKDIQEFAQRFAACSSGAQWAKANCKSMQEVWDKIQGEWLVWIATRKGVLTDQELMGFSLFMARKVEPIAQDKRCTQAIDVLEQVLAGKLPKSALPAAYAVVKDAQENAEPNRKMVEISASICMAVGQPAWSSGCCANAMAIGQSLAKDRSQVREEQLHHQLDFYEECAAWLRANTKPMFEENRQQ